MTDLLAELRYAEATARAQRMSHQLKTAYLRGWHINPTRGANAASGGTRQYIEIGASAS
jgi:hypothetical protein